VSGGSAADRWRDGLTGWAIPEDILAAAPVSPWGFSVAGFADRARRQRESPTPAHDLAREALLEGGTVLDVGCGGGAASLPLIPPAGHVTGVDENPGMLAVFREAVESAGAAATTVAGRWPEVAGRVDVHDVVVAQDVAYNVPDLAAFARELDRHARLRVVIVLPTVHPMSWTTPYWRRLHGLARPTEPTVVTAVAVLTDLGFDVQRESWREPTLWSFVDPALAVEDVRQRLCLTADRDDEVRAALADAPVPVEREAWALWWTPSGESAG
jgi:SAM-dependent methyltransferase